MPATMSRRECTMPHSEWFKNMRQLGLTFPDTYVVFDLETTGLFFDIDYIVQFGHLVVENCVPRQPIATTLDWINAPGVNLDHFYSRLADVIARFPGYRFNAQRIVQEGVDPLAVVQIYYDMLKDHQDAGGYFVTHNGIAYDAPMCVEHFKRFLGKDFEFNLDHIVDTGMLAKAAQIDKYPYGNESMTSFYKRIKDIRSKQQWKLTPICVDRYQLNDRLDLDMRGAHTAGFDCLLTHLLAERFRNLSLGFEA